MMDERALVLPFRSVCPSSTWLHLPDRSPRLVLSSPLPVTSLPFGLLSSVPSLPVQLPVFSCSASLIQFLSICFVLSSSFIHPKVLLCKSP